MMAGQRLTPDESRAVALLVDDEPALRVEMWGKGWGDLAAEQAERAEALFAAEWDRPVDHDDAVRHLAGKHNQESHGRKGAGSGDGDGGKGVEGASVVTTRYDDLSDSAKAHIDAYAEKWGIDRDAITAEFVAALRDEDAWAKGKDWYEEEMRGTAVRLADETKGMKHPVSVETALGVIAITSARNGWETKKGHRPNEETARSLVQAHASGRFDGMTAAQAMGDKTWAFGYLRGEGFGLNAMRALKGEQPVEDAVTGAKRSSFFQNGRNPYSNNDVTVDVWMANPMARHSNDSMSLDKAQGHLAGKAPQYLEREGVTATPAYFIMAEAVRAAWDQGLAEGLIPPEAVPSQVQAAAWFHQQGGGVEE